jgi:hypothetical protein
LIGFGWFSVLSTLVPLGIFTVHKPSSSEPLCPNGTISVATDDNMYDSKQGLEELVLRS